MRRSAPVRDLGVDLDESCRRRALDLLGFSFPRQHNENFHLLSFSPMEKLSLELSFLTHTPFSLPSSFPSPYLPVS